MASNDDVIIDPTAHAIIGALRRPAQIAKDDAQQLDPHSTLSTDSADASDPLTSPSTPQTFDSQSDPLPTVATQVTTVMQAATTTVALTGLTAAAQAVQSGNTTVTSNSAFATLKAYGAFTTNSAGATVVNQAFVQSIGSMGASQQTAVMQAIAALQMSLSSSSASSSAALTSTQSATAAAAAQQGFSGLSFLTPGVDPKPAPPDPNAPPPPPPPPASKGQQISQGVGAVVGLIPLIASNALVTGTTIASIGSGAINGLKVALSNLSHLGQAFVVISLVLGAYNLFTAFNNMFVNGFSWGQLGQVLLSAGSVYLSLVKVLGPMGALLVTGALVVGTLVVAAVKALLKWLFGKKPTDAEKEMGAFDDLTVWSTKQVLTLASTAAFMTMGYNIDNPANLGVGISIPTTVLQQALSYNLGNSDGSAYSGSIPYGVPLLLKGQGVGGGDRVVIISQNGIQNGKSMDMINTYDLSKNMVFTKPTRADGAYLSFFGADGKPNPAAVTAVNTQRAILQAIPGLTTSSQNNATALVGTLDKQNVTPVAVPSN